MSKSLINKGLKYGTKLRERGLREVRGTATSKVILAPQDGAVLETMELFQHKFRTPIAADSDDDDNPAATSPACILPTGWGKRLRKPSTVYRYSADEISMYNAVLELEGPRTAKSWADIQWRKRDDRDNA